MGTTHRARSDAPGATRVHLGTRVPLHATPARAWLPVPPGLSRCGTAIGAAGEEGPAARPRGLYPRAQGWRNFRGRQRDAPCGRGQHPRGPLQRQTEAGRLPATVWGGVAGSAAGHTTSLRAHRVAAARGPQPLGHLGGPGAHVLPRGRPRDGQRASDHAEMSPHGLSAGGLVASGPRKRVTRAFCFLSLSQQLPGGPSKGLSLAGKGAGTGAAGAGRRPRGNADRQGRISSPSSSDLCSKRPADVSICGRLVGTPASGSPARPGCGTPSPAPWEPLRTADWAGWPPRRLLRLIAAPAAPPAWPRGSLFLPGCSGVTLGSHTVPRACLTARSPFLWLLKVSHLLLDRSLSSRRPCLEIELRV